MRASNTFLASASLALALTACGSETTVPIEGEDGETGEYTVNNATGESSATITTDEGTATMRSGANVPVDLPGGFSLYPGAQVVSNIVGSFDGDSGSLVTMSTSDSPQEVAAFYKKQAQDAGVAIEMELSTNGGQMIGGQSENGLTFSVLASPSEEGTTAQLTVGQQTD